MTEKDKVLKVTDRLSQEFSEIAQLIHKNPELSFEEEYACELLSNYLEKYGFDVERGIADLSTAFTATWWGKAEGPHIGIIAEYDALPKLGHACGHNLIAAAAVGAAVSLKVGIPDFNGRITVIGTPAEEGGGGKIHMVDKGVFSGIDVVMMVHPKNKTMVLRGGLACVSSRFKFYGKESHASSAPEKGVSALEALINSFNAINSLRQFFTDEVRVHGIVTNGGEAPNIVPNYSESQFIIRASNTKVLEVTKQKVYAAVRNAAKSVGARCEINEGLTYAERNNNVALANIFKNNWESLGVKVEDPPIQGGLGSSDIGNVGQVTATIHPYIKIGENVNHTVEFAEDSVSEKGMKGLSLAIKGMSLTAIDIAYNKDNLNEVRNEFEKWQKENN